MTSDVRILEQVVLHQPERDEPRQRLADLLSERGDPRGAFIRLQLLQASQIRLQELGAEHIRLHRQCARLLRDHQGTWAKPIAGLVTSYEFQRGFPEIVNINTRKFLRDAAAIYQVAPVVHLRLTGAAGALGELWDSRMLSRLCALDLSGSGLTDDDAALIASSAQLPGLRLLDLSQNNIGAAGLEALAKSERLGALRCLLFAGNRAPDPCDQPTIERGEIVAYTRSEQGLEIERRFGPRSWLRFRPRVPMLQRPPSALFISGT